MGAVTVIADEADFPSLDAETETVPADTAVTTPEVDTVATEVLLELHEIARPVNTLSFASLVTADSCTVPPTCRLLDEGDTDTDATAIGAGALTLSAEEFALPSLEALIIAVPGPTAFTSPDASTVAMLVLELSQVTVRPERGAPVESTGVAVATAVWPITTAEGLTATMTFATGVGGLGMMDIGA